MIVGCLFVGQNDTVYAVWYMFRVLRRFQSPYIHHWPIRDLILKFNLFNNTEIIMIIYWAAMSVSHEADEINNMVGKFLPIFVENL